MTTPAPITTADAFVLGCLAGLVATFAVVALATVATLAAHVTVWTARRIVALADRHQAARLH
jgi:hypothetical protein